MPIQEKDLSQFEINRKINLTYSDGSVTEVKETGSNGVVKTTSLTYDTGGNVTSVNISTE